MQYMVFANVPAASVVQTLGVCMLSMALVHSRDCFKHFVHGHHGIKEFTKGRDLIEMDEHEQTAVPTESSKVPKF